MFEAFYLNGSPGSPTHLLLSGLATILPLLTWIRFTNAPSVLYPFELTGRIPLWSWAILNKGRKLVGDTPASDGKCVINRFGRSLNVICLDGRYGNKYFLQQINIENHHMNMALIDKRVYKLALIHVLRASDEDRDSISTTSLLQRLFSWAGWWILLALIAAAIYLHYWVAAAYLVVIPATGIAFYYTRGGPCRLRMDNSSSQYERLVTTAKLINVSYRPASYSARNPRGTQFLFK